MTYSFEKLDIWQDARVLVKMIYEMTNKFPDTEKFGLISQLRRAMVSVCSNMAEGSTRRSPNDQARFYEIAYGSAIEVYCQLILSHDLGFINDEQLQLYQNQIESISRRLSKLHDSAKNRANPKSTR